MFTLEQIKQAHSKVKTGADFPAYIREIKALGVISYETFVVDGHTDYFGINQHKATLPAKYAPLTISDQSDATHFKTELKAHQQGKTNYLTFIEVSAATGVERWTVDMTKMTCTYYDKGGNTVLEELIPQ